MDVDTPPPEHDPAATSDAGGGAGITCWAEEVEQINSTHDSEEILRSLCRSYGIREEQYRSLCAKNGWGPCKAIPNAVCVYEGMLEAGVRFPLRDFYSEYLRHCAIAPSQLAPNAWRFLVGFVRLCDGAGVRPEVAVFNHYFKLYALGGTLQGWYYVVPFSRNRRLFKSNGNLPANDREWKKKFFFLESLSPGLPWRCPEKWGTPGPDYFARRELTDAAKAAVTRLESEKKEGISLMELLDKPQDSLPIVPSPLQTPVEAEASAGAAALTHPPKRKYKALSAITPPEQLDMDAESSPPPPDFIASESPPRGHGGEHSASQMLAEALTAIQRTEKELCNAKHELREEKAKHAEELRAAKADVAWIKSELGAAKADHMAAAAKFQAAEAKQAAKIAQLTAEEAKVHQLTEELRVTRAEHTKALGGLSEARAQLKVLWAAQSQHTATVRLARENLQVAKAEHSAVVGRLMAEREAKVRQLTDELEAEKAKRLAKISQLTDDLHAAEAEHAAKALQLGKELQMERTERAAEVKAVRAECQIKVINAEHTSGIKIGEMLSERYAAGLRDMRDLALISGVDPEQLLTPEVLASSVPPGFPPRQAPADQEQAMEQMEIGLKNGDAAHLSSNLCSSFKQPIT